MAATNTSLSDVNPTKISSTSSIDDNWYIADHIAWPIIRGIIGTTGIIGNLLVCIVVVRIWSGRNRNATNTLIANQALIDCIASAILVAVTITETLKVPPPDNQFFGQLICKFWSSRMLLFGAFAISVLNLTAISVERYLAVIHPIYYSMKFANTFVSKWLPVVPWLLGPIWQFVIALLRYEYVPSQVWCIYESERYTDAMEKIFGIIIFLWEYFLPVIFMTYAVIKIALKFRQQNLTVGPRPAQRSTKRAFTVSAAVSTMNANDNSVSALDQSSPMDADSRTLSNTNTRTLSNTNRVDQNGPSSRQVTRTTGRGHKHSSNIQRRNVTKMLFTVYVVYVVCWSLDAWAFLQYNLGGQLDFGGVFWNTAILFAQLNSCVNPFIYGLQYREYRKGLKKLFMCKK